MTTPVYQILKAINLTNVTLLLTSCLQIWNINFIKLTSFSTLWAVTIIYFLWLVKKHKEKINASKKDVKLLQKFYGEAYTVQVEETQDPEHNGNNRRVNVRPSITVDDNTGNACNLPDNCMPENDIFDKNGDTNPRTDKDLLPTSLFLVFLITGTHICAFGIISYMAMLERTWSCLMYSVIYVLIGTIYLLLTFSHGTAEKNRLKLYQTIYQILQVFIFGAVIVLAFVVRSEKYAETEGKLPWIRYRLVLYVLLAIYTGFQVILTLNSCRKNLMK